MRIWSACEGLNLDSGMLALNTMQKTRPASPDSCATKQAAIT